MMFLTIEHPENVSLAFTDDIHPCGSKFSSKDDFSPLISSLQTKILFQR